MSISIIDDIQLRCSPKKKKEKCFEKKKITRSGMFFGSDRRNLRKTLHKTLWRNDDFTLTSHCDFTTIGVTSCDVNVKSLWRECEDVMTAFFDLTLWLHKVKSLCHFNVENVAFVTILPRVGWPDFTRMRSGFLGSTFFFFYCNRFMTFVTTLRWIGWPDFTRIQFQKIRICSFFVLVYLSRCMIFVTILYRVGRSDFIQIGSNKFGYRLSAGRRGGCWLAKILAILHRVELLNFSRIRSGKFGLNFFFFRLNLYYGSSVLIFVNTIWSGLGIHIYISLFLLQV